VRFVSRIFHCHGSDLTEYLNLKRLLIKNVFFYSKIIRERTRGLKSFVCHTTRNFVCMKSLLFSYTFFF